MKKHALFVVLLLAGCGLAGNLLRGQSTESATTADAGTEHGAAPDNTADSGAPSDPDLAAQIENTLRADPSLSQDNIEVSADESQILLTGTVGSGKEKLTAERIAASYAADRKVVNRIAVNAHK